MSRVDAMPPASGASSNKAMEAGTASPVIDRCSRILVDETKTEEALTLFANEAVNSKGKPKA